VRVLLRTPYPSVFKTNTLPLASVCHGVSLPFLSGNDNRFHFHPSILQCLSGFDGFRPLEISVAITATFSPVVRLPSDPPDFQVAASAFLTE